MIILIYISIAFVGYVFGRFCHYYLNRWLKNPKWAPHHWIYGLILIIAGIIYIEQKLGLVALTFGAGFFISDLKDFLKFKILSPDDMSKHKFWGID